MLLKLYSYMEVSLRALGNIEAPIPWTYRMMEDFIIQPICRDLHACRVRYFQAYQNRLMLLVFCFPILQRTWLPPVRNKRPWRNAKAVITGTGVCGVPTNTLK